MALRPILKYQRSFYRGNYADLVALTIDAHPSNIPSGVEALVVGALGNVGRVAEARHLFDRLKTSFSIEDQVAAQYHLGVSYTRHSQYAEAIGFFTKNLGVARRSKDSHLRFYAFMGLGFYRFFCSRFARCIRDAEAALLSAQDAGFTYGKYQALELLGHAKVNVGLISEGLADIRQAERLAAAFGNGSMVESFRIARACYEVQFGIGGTNSVPNLAKLHQTTPLQNTYSRATLLLEMAQVTALQGNVTQSQNYLNQASRIVYETRHRRYGAYLHFRYAYNAYLAGKFDEALNMLRAAENPLHRAVDKLMLLKICDLELKVRKQMGLDLGQNLSLENRITDLTSKTGNAVACKILERRSRAVRTKLGFGEDPIGDLLDTPNTTSSTACIVSVGYLTALRDRLKIPFGKCLLILNIEKDCSLVVDRADLRTVVGLSRQLQKMLVVLGAGEKSKEGLVAEIWGYRHYDPLRHDGVLFQAIARLRQVLGPQREWLLNTEHGYRLHETVSVTDYTAPSELPAVDKEKVRGNAQPDLAVKSRLDCAKAQLKNREFMTRDYVNTAGVSKATACRDLSELTASKELKKIGNGKKTRYRFL